MFALTHIFAGLKQKRTTNLSMWVSFAYNPHIHWISKKIGINCLNCVKNKYELLVYISVFICYDSGCTN